MLPTSLNPSFNGKTPILIPQTHPNAIVRQPNDVIEIDWIADRIPSSDEVVMSPTNATDLNAQATRDEMQKAAGSHRQRVNGSDPGNRHATAVKPSPPIASGPQSTARSWRCSGNCGATSMSCVTTSTKIVRIACEMTRMGMIPGCVRRLGLAIARGVRMTVTDCLRSAPAPAIARRRTVSPTIACALKAQAASKPGNCNRPCRNCDRKSCDCDRSWNRAEVWILRGTLNAIDHWARRTGHPAIAHRVPGRAAEFAHLGKPTVRVLKISIPNRNATHLPATGTTRDGQTHHATRIVHNNRILEGIPIEPPVNDATTDSKWDR